MSPKYTRITEASTRSPRSAWTQPRSTEAVLIGLERNGFQLTQFDRGMSLMRACGHLALRVTIVDNRALLETGMWREGAPVRWRPCPERIGVAPWQVAYAALEMLATIDVDTPVRWG